MSWQNCTESSCKYKHSTERIDPVLKLYHKMPIMLSENFDVESGIANGTTGTLEKIVLKNDSTIQEILVDDIPVQSIFASQVVCIFIHIQKLNKTIKLTPKTFTGFSAKLPLPHLLQSANKTTISVNMTAFQLPIIQNNCTTGHKLQGDTLKALFVTSFTYLKNWTYVVLSRVCTWDGLFLVEPLKSSQDFSLDNNLHEMTKYLYEKKHIPHTILDIQ